MIEVKGIKAVVTDIEGTTSSISFVHDVLFPYARTHLADYVYAHERELDAIFDGVRELENDPALTTGDIVTTLVRWIGEDRKATPLKSLQGMIWKSGFASGAFKGHIYDDAAKALKEWSARGLKLYVYSSGSVAAQKLLYGHSERGDLTPLFSGYFDTTTGPKLETDSYVEIAAAVGLAPSEILFLSDHTGEIDAAGTAGFKTVLLDRDKAQGADTPYKVASDFSEITLLP